MKKRLIITVTITVFVLSLTGAYAQEETDKPEYQEGRQCQGPVCEVGHQGGGPSGQGGPQERGRGPNKEKFFKKIVEELNLTTEQQEALRQQRTGHREKRKALMETLRTKKEALRAELEKEEIDKERIDSIVSEIKPLLGQQIELRVEDTLAMKEILTAEQYQKFQEFIKKKKKGRGKRGFGKRGHHKGSGNREFEKGEFGDNPQTEDTP
jgi:Spy/CpxP family protein refolding chaperone